MFGKLQNTSQINTSGIGLGLFICKRICESFNGSIMLSSSAPDLGSEFCFIFETNGCIEETKLSEQIPPRINEDKYVDVSEINLNMDKKSVNLISESDAMYTINIPEMLTKMIKDEENVEEESIFKNTE